MWSPRDWDFGGYREIVHPRKRYAVIDHESLMSLLDVNSQSDLERIYKGWIDEAIQKRNQLRESRWTESVAVGNKAFVLETKEKLGFKVKGRKVLEKEGSFELREPPVSYGVHFVPKNTVLSAQNTYYWGLNH